MVTDIKNKIGLRGIAKIETIDKDGKVLDRQIVHNKVVNTGIEAMLQKITNAYTENITQFKIGNGTTAPAAGDTDLESPIA